MPESHNIIDLGFRVITLKSPVRVLHGELPEANAARILDAVSPRPSALALKLRMVRRHTWACARVILRAVIWIAPHTQAPDF